MTRHALRPAPRFELLAQLLMSTNAEAELKRFNPFLKRPCAAVREQNRTEQNRTPRGRLPPLPLASNSPVSARRLLLIVVCSNRQGREYTHAV